ncbi:MAG: YhdH/YhfP family quinone oxidoreductase [Trueperaceae bacterium]
MTEGVPDNYRALRVHVTGEAVDRAVEQVPWSTLTAPEHAGARVSVRVEYSSLNYKDALSASGNRGVTRDYPHTPGIDAAGRVVASADPRFEPGAQVLVTGFDLGMNTPGGFGQYVNVPGEWLVPLPGGLSTRSAMALGTAGLTAAIALERLAFAGATSDLGPLVVTGASGGVGSLAVALAAAAGYEVIASTGKPQAAPLLERLGAARTVGRSPLNEPSERPLLRGQYAGAIDTVGGDTLVNLVKSTVVGGAVAACGLVGGADLSLTVHPFILRGVALLGVDSQHLPMETRVELWRSLAQSDTVKRALEVPGLVTETTLDGLEEHVGRILAGEVMGRVIVSL